MARISFTSEISELVGKLAGSVFQYSYGGFQVHTRVSPSNPETQKQQLRRGWFGYIAANWRSLSPGQQNTWITEAGSQPKGFRLYLASNINLFLVELGPALVWSSSPAPGSMEIEIVDYSASSLIIKAIGGTTTVPANNRLLIYITAEKVLNKRFTNPSDYYPVLYYDALTDISSDQDITAEWESVFGVLQGGQRVCLKAVLINSTNGSRGADFIVCSPPVTGVTFYLTDSDGSPIIDSDGTFVVFQ